MLGKRATLFEYLPSIEYVASGGCCPPILGTTALVYCRPSNTRPVSPFSSPHATVHRPSTHPMLHRGRLHRPPINPSLPLSSRRAPEGSHQATSQECGSHNPQGAVSYHSPTDSAVSSHFHLISPHPSRFPPHISRLFCHGIQPNQSAPPEASGNQNERTYQTRTHPRKAIPCPA